MMERILLGVFCLSGWHILSSSCLPRQYHYVADPMNWTEAQNYCRENYTDLATFESAEKMNRFINTVFTVFTEGKLFDKCENSEFWIGVYTNFTWMWSDGYRETGPEYRKWETNEPNFYAAHQFCVVINKSGRWLDYKCSRPFPFICSRDTVAPLHQNHCCSSEAFGGNAHSNFIFVKESMNWSSAQRYCRENFMDLATVRNDAENQEIQNLITSGAEAWIGLFREPDFYWSDESNFSFSHWARVENVIGSNSVMCGVSDFHRSGKWKLLSCKERLTFFCYSVPPVRRQIVKLRVMRGDPSVDLNDPAVKADILKKLQKELQDKGISGVNLKWREQPDGKVFHKEGETSQKKKNRKKTEL